MDTALSPPVGLLLGGRYQVGSQIARGGMATVYLGTDTRLDRVVALKIAHPELSDDAEFVRRFIGEARSAARLSSPNVVGIYDQGSDKRLHYIAMEYVPGRTLRQLLNERGRLSPHEALDVMTGVLAGLDAAHSAGLAHRDVKPENVLLTASGGIKVADFGLARAMAGAVQTKGGMIIGTAAYLAPEQVSGGTSDARTDVYAAGIMLYELLTGSQPHTGDSPLDVAYKHVHETVPAPSAKLPGLPGSLDALVAMATSRDPDLRPANAGQFLRAVAEVRDSRAAPSGGPHQAQAARPGSGPLGAPPGFPAAAAHPASAPYAASAPHPGSAPYPGRAPYPEPAPVSHSGPLDYAGPGYHQAAPGSAGYSAPGGYPDHGLAQDSHPYRLGDPPAPFSPGGQGAGHPPPGSDHGEQSWERRPGAAVGASALPSLSPQSAIDGPVRSGARGGDLTDANHTLVVAEPMQFGEYPGADGYGDGSGYRSGRYGRRTSRHSLSGLRPERLVFSRRLFILSGGLALVLVIALVAWWITSGRYETVPPLHGIAKSTAEHELRNLGLTATFTQPAHNPLPAGEVIKTSPGSGSKIAGGSTVKLTVSLGPVLIQVPDVSGQPLAQAQGGLRSAHLRVSPHVRKMVSSTVPVGDVISTIPRAYAKCPQSRPVILVVSAGPGLPNFVGMQVTDAQAAAASGGYTINPVANANGSQPANTITRQSPSANTPITPGEVVTVYYSPGPPLVQVPDVRGLQLQQAMLELQRAGFQVTVNRSGPGNNVGNYSPTTPQPKGSMITVDVGWFSGL